MSMPPEVNPNLAEPSRFDELRAKREADAASGTTSRLEALQSLQAEGITANGAQIEERMLQIDAAKAAGDEDEKADPEPLQPTG